MEVFLDEFDKIWSILVCDHLMKVDENNPHISKKEERLDVDLRDEKLIERI